jgi:hypothetical protein
LRSRYLLFFALLYVSSIAYAQNYHHNVFSLALTIADTINQRTKLELSLQKRTQNTTLDRNNFFKTSQLNSVLFWLNFAVSKTSKISVSPFAYYENFPLIAKVNDENLSPVKEFRFSVRYTNDHRSKIVDYGNRYSVEYRVRDLKHDGVYRSNFRMRYMAKLEKSFNGLLSHRKPVTFQLNDEVFLQFGKAVHNRPNVFDQNRIYLGFNYEVLKNFKTSLGYLYGFQERNTGDEFDNVNMLWVVLTFDNVFTQFRRQ